MTDISVRQMIHALNDLTELDLQSAEIEALKAEYCRRFVAAEQDWMMRQEQPDADE